LGLDGGEVLDVVAEDAAQVLDEPVEQRSEVQRIPRGPLVVVAVWVDGCAVLADLAVARAGERDEHRRAEHLAVRRSVGLADRMRANLPLAGPGRPDGAESTADAGASAVQVGFAPQPGPLGLLIKAARCARRGPALAPASAFLGEARPARAGPTLQPSLIDRAHTAGIRTGTLPSSSAGSLSSSQPPRLGRSLRSRRMRSAAPNRRPLTRGFGACRARRSRLGADSKCPIPVIPSLRTARRPRAGTSPSPGATWPRPTPPSPRLISRPT